MTLTDETEDSGRIGSLMKSAIAARIPEGEPDFGQVYFARRRERRWALSGLGAAACLSAFLIAGMVAWLGLSGHRAYALEVASLGKSLLPETSHWVLAEADPYEGATENLSETDFLSVVWSDIAALYETETQ